MGERVMATERVADQTAHSDFYALNAAVDQALEMPVELVEPNYFAGSYIRKRSHPFGCGLAQSDERGTNLH